MVFGRGGFAGRLIIGWIALWPAIGAAEPPPVSDPEPHARVEYEVPFGPSPRHRVTPTVQLAPFSFDAIGIGKRGVEYRSTLSLRRREIPFRVWGGRKHKQPALGIEFEKRSGTTRFRAGAYGTQKRIGLAIRIRY